MKNQVLVVLAAIGATTTLGIAAAGVVGFTGLIDVSADTPHSPIVYAAIEELRKRAIDRQARDIAPPKDLSDPERLHRGAGNYAAMCASCHLTPGQEDSEIRMGLYPAPPDLTKTTLMGKSPEAKGARRFWIIKHGIKASGMPAWSKGGMDDAAIWDLTAFLDRLPALSAEKYRDLVDASDGHAHAGVKEEHHEDATEEHHDEIKPPQHVDKPDLKPHTH